MTKKILIAFTTMAIAIATAASSYKVTLFQPSQVGGKELKPGEYKVSVQENKVIISSGKQSVEAEAKLETAEGKFSATAIRYAAGESNRIQEIRIGGTNTKIVFN